MTMPGGQAQVTERMKPGVVHSYESSLKYDPLEKGKYVNGTYKNSGQIWCDYLATDIRQDFKRPALVVYRILGNLSASGVQPLAVSPPSTYRICPVTKSDAGEARKIHAPTISSVSPNRPISCWSNRC